MTSTLLLRFAAPRQSWGEVGTERHRTTAKIPTRTGLTGLLSACLGLHRGETDSRLHDLRMLVRVDRPGVIETDYQTVSAPPADIADARRRAFRIRTYSRIQGRTHFTVPLGNGEPWLGGKEAHVSERQYLADAEFIVAFSGDDQVVEDLSRATRRPVFSPYLGRQAFAPAFPFHLGTRAGDGLPTLERLASTVPTGNVLRVHEVTPGRPTQVARIDPPRTTTPLVDWRS